MTEYTASLPVYVDGVYYEAGLKFSTDKPKGSTWSEVKKPRAEPEPAPEPDRKTLTLPK